MIKLKQVMQHFFVYFLRFTLTSTNKKRIFLVETLSDFNISISYNEVLKTKEDNASTLRDKFQENNVYFPFPLSQQEMLYFAIDSADFTKDTPDGKN